MKLDNIRVLVETLKQAKAEVDAELYLDHPKLSHLHKIIEETFQTAGDQSHSIRVGYCSAAMNLLQLGVIGHTQSCCGSWYYANLR